MTRHTADFQLPAGERQQAGLRVGSGVVTDEALEAVEVVVVVVPDQLGRGRYPQRGKTRRQGVRR